MKPPKPSPIPATSGPGAPSGRRAARQLIADTWLNLLFWSACHYPRFVRWSKPLWVWGAWRFSAALRTNTLLNARRVLGEQASNARSESLARAVIGSFYDFVGDVGRSVGRSPEQLRQRIERVDGLEHYTDARKRRHGAIIVTAHMGSFEVAIASLAEHERTIHVLFRRDASGLFERTRSALRRQLGIMETCVDDGLGAWMRLREALKRDEVVLVQGDRVMPGQKGQCVPFLGGHLLVPVGPVKLALASGAPIVPIFSTRLSDGRIRLSIETPIFVTEGTEVDAAVRHVAAVVEQHVRQNPGQWLMVCRAFREDMST